VLDLFKRVLKKPGLASASREDCDFVTTLDCIAHMMGASKGGSSQNQDLQRTLSL
jgi:hypothetical protein